MCSVNIPADMHHSLVYSFSVIGLCDLIWSSVEFDDILVICSVFNSSHIFWLAYVIYFEAIFWSVYTCMLCMTAYTVCVDIIVVLLAKIDTEITLSICMLLQGLKLTLVRGQWILLPGLPPVKSAFHWPIWHVKFGNPTSEFIWLSASFSYRMNQCKYLEINTDINKYAWPINTSELNIKRDFLFSHFVSGPVEVLN